MKKEKAANKKTGEQLQTRKRKGLRRLPGFPHKNRLKNPFQEDYLLKPSPGYRDLVVSLLLGTARRAPTELRVLRFFTCRADQGGEACLPVRAR